MSAEMPVPDQEARRRFLRILPDPQICRARPIGSIKAFADCLVDRPVTCPYAMSFGKGYFCKHPDWEGFVQP